MSLLMNELMSGYPKQFVCFPSPSFSSHSFTDACFVWQCKVALEYGLDLMQVQFSFIGIRI
jgi:hypothetical protein